MQCCNGTTDLGLSQYEYVPLPLHSIFQNEAQTLTLIAAIMMEDSQTGQRYLQVKHFISRGIPSSVITLLVVVTVGYGLMRVTGL